MKKLLTLSLILGLVISVGHGLSIEDTASGFYSSGDNIYVYNDINPLQGCEEKNGVSNCVKTEFSASETMIYKHDNYLRNSTAGYYAITKNGYAKIGEAKDTIIFEDGDNLVFLINEDTVKVFAESHYRVANDYVIKVGSFDKDSFKYISEGNASQRYYSPNSMLLKDKEKVFYGNYIHSFFEIYRGSPDLQIEHISQVFDEEVIQIDGEIYILHNSLYIPFERYDSYSEIISTTNNGHEYVDTIENKHLTITKYNDVRDGFITGISIDLNQASKDYLDKAIAKYKMIVPSRRERQIVNHLKSFGYQEYGKGSLGGFSGVMNSGILTSDLQSDTYEKILREIVYSYVLQAMKKNIR